MGDYIVNCTNLFSRKMRVIDYCIFVVEVFLSFSITFGFVDRVFSSEFTFPNRHCSPRCCVSILSAVLLSRMIDYIFSRYILSDTKKNKT